MQRGEGYRRGRGEWRPNKRQRRVLDLLVEGRTNPEIAETLGITLDGAKWHLGELLAATGSEDRQTLASWWRGERERSRAAGTWLFQPVWRLLAIGSTAVIVTLVGAGWLLLAPKGGSSGVEAPITAVGIDAGFVAGGNLKPLEPLFSEFLVELAVDVPLGRSRVDLRDLSSGALRASVDAGFRPMVLVRQKGGGIAGVVWVHG